MVSAVDTFVATGALGKYRLERLLSRGLRASTYAARDGAEEVAVKVVSSSAYHELERFRRELRVLRRLHHPGIVQILDSSDEASNQPWYAMEFLAGGTLVDHRCNLLDRAAAASSVEPESLRTEAQVGAIIELSQQLCAALAHLHSLGVVHCDLKPQNIMLRGDTPVLIDFGSSVEFGFSGRERFQVEKEIAGTAYYIAPEQLQGALLDARTDLYALGCILFELLCGRPPFLGALDACVEQHLTTPPPFVHELVAGIPPKLSALIARLLEKNPKRRFGYADDVRKQLLDIQQVSATLSHGPSTDIPYLHRSPFLGQPRALRELRAALGAASQGVPQFLLATGESGIGKTRFALEASLLAQEHEFHVIAAECREISSSGEVAPAATGGPLHPFQPLVDYWSHFLREDARDTASGSRSSLGAQREVAFTLEALKGLFPELDRIPRAAIEMDQRRDPDVTAGMLQVLRSVTSEQPLMLIIDDLQWADQLTLSLLGRAFADGSGLSKLAVLALARSESKDRLLSTVGASGSTPLAAPQTIELERLSRAEVSVLVRELLARDSLDQALLDSIYAVSEGNPLMVNELLRSAIDAGQFVRSADGEWQTAPEAPVSEASLLERLPLPKSLVELIDARTRGLSETAKNLLSIAAALGREFEREMLGPVAIDVSRIDASDLSMAMAELESRQILFSLGRDRYRFSHDKFREIPYVALSDAERRRIHLHAAVHIEGLASGKQGEAFDAASAGIHWSRAGVRDRAAACFAQAGDRLASAFANAQAAVMYATALQELQGTGEKPGALLGKLSEALGDVRARMGDHAEARASLSAALDVAHDSDRTRRAQLLRKIAMTWQNQLRAQAALEALSRAEQALAEGSTDATQSELFASIQIERALICYWHNDMPQMEQALAMVPAAIVSDGHPALRARYFEALACAGFRHDRYRMSPATIRAARNAVTAATASADPQLLMTSHWTLGMALLFGDELEHAELHLLQAADRAAHLGDAKHELSARAYVSLTLRLRGDVNGVQSISEKLLEKAPGGMMAAWTALADANLSWVKLRQGRWAQASAHIDRALTFWKGMPTPYPFQWTALLPLLELQLRQGHSEWFSTASAMLDPKLHALPESSLKPLMEAVESEARGDSLRARELAWHCVDNARDAGYL